MALSLLEPADLAEAGPSEAVRLPLELIDASPRNPRLTLVEVDALAENIRAFSLLQPVVVRRLGERYELIGGHRRHAAFHVLRDQYPLEVEWKTIPAVVRSSDSDDRDYLRLISSQVHHQGWRPREEASALERLAIAGLSVTEIGERLQRTKGWASKRLRVYADAVLSGYVQTEQLSSGVAEELLIIRSPERRREFAERAVAEGWSQDEARTQVRALDVVRQPRAAGKLARELLRAIANLGPDDFSPGDVRVLGQLLQELRRVAQRPKKGEARKAYFPPLPATAQPRKARPKRRAMPAPA